MRILELENDMTGWSKIISDVQLNSNLSQIEQGQLKELLYEYSNLFSNIPGCINFSEHDMELESERAIVAKAYRMSPGQIQILQSEFSKMLELKIIVPGESDFTSLFVKNNFNYKILRAASTRCSALEEEIQSRASQLK
ncbi:retrovirus-related Pol polyprotein from transposon 297 [Trichonephila clavipes]|uniref:Retrovirus-related Pol polyprotein from transposon 297 n=1 Tax=Trichonephila clavipes TaxID=2585209 RepID=A0A8X6S2A6_TRICX|nr:retrovirus-related Pol polyprotein from transposon 297 [Trichonephila clavipes]